MDGEALLSALKGLQVQTNSHNQHSSNNAALLSLLQPNGNPQTLGGTSLPPGFSQHNQPGYPSHLHAPPPPLTGQHLFPQQPQQQPQLQNIRTLPPGFQGLPPQLQPQNILPPPGFPSANIVNNEQRHQHNAPLPFPGMTTTQQGGPPPPLHQHPLFPMQQQQYQQHNQQQLLNLQHLGLQQQQQQLPTMHNMTTMPRGGVSATGLPPQLLHHQLPNTLSLQPQRSRRMPKADLALLNKQLEDLAASIAPTKEELDSQQRAFEQVKSILLKQWPHANVVMFGSVANGLSVRSSNDIDVCLELAEVGDDTALKSDVAVEIGDALERAGMTDVLALPKARVPVVKFVVPETGTKVDITVNNTLACLNTKLLADYCAVDDRLRKLVAVVKHWAKRRAVNDPYRGTLSSYAYVLICIHLLQTRSPPVLPVLQQLPNTFSRTVGPWYCGYCDSIDILRGFGAHNTETLAELVWAFFEYWAWGFDYAHRVISVRVGGTLTKEEKGWTTRIGTERHLLCIEDPFQLDHDLGRTVDRETRSVMRKEFTRAAQILRDAVDPLPELFFMYTKEGGDKEGGKNNANGTNNKKK